MWLRVKGLLDALDALGEQREALILAGAQAIYIHTGAADLAVAEFTIDGDLEVVPEQLKIQPDFRRQWSGLSFDQGFSPEAGCATEPFRVSQRRDPSTCSCRRLSRALMTSRASW